MKAVTQKPDSPALVLIKHVWEHNREATGHSWTRLNGSMRDAVSLAISAGLRFDRDDFTLIAATMRIGYWCGDDRGEPWYRLAIELDHPSAYQSYEAWRGRRPFIIDGTRLFVGQQLRWTPNAKEAEGWWTITSFADDQSSLTAVQYAETPEGGGYARTKVSRRCRITRSDIHERNARVKGFKAAAADRQKKIDEQIEVAAHGARWFKVLMDGQSFHGGSLKWSLPKADKPGEWHEVVAPHGMGTPTLCAAGGLHLTKVPVLWWVPGAEVFEVEIPEGARIQGNFEKSAVLKCRLLRKIEGEELKQLGISATRATETEAA